MKSIGDPRRLRGLRPRNRWFMRGGKAFYAGRRGRVYRLEGRTLVLVA